MKAAAPRWPGKTTYETRVRNGKARGPTGNSAHRSLPPVCSPLLGSLAWSRGSWWAMVRRSVSWAVAWSEAWGCQGIWGYQDIKMCFSLSFGGSMQGSNFLFKMNLWGTMPRLHYIISYHYHIMRYASASCPLCTFRMQSGNSEWRTMNNLSHHQI